MEKSILVAGSLAFDHLYEHKGSFVEGIDTSDLDDLSVSFSVTNHKVRKGGAGANMAWNLGLMSTPVELFCAVGKDAEEYLKELKERGVGTQHITVYDEGDTPHCAIATDKKLRQITFFDSGVELKKDWLSSIENIENIEWLIVGPWQPEFALPVFEWSAAHYVPSIFDPGQHILDYNEDELHSVLEIAHGVILNDYEWRLLQERSALSKEEIIERVDFVIVTKGENGFAILDKKAEKDFPACTLDNTVNPTGAGDAFRAGMLSGLHQKKTLAEACMLGAALASKAVEQEGALLESVDIAELEERIAKAYL